MTTPYYADGSVTLHAGDCIEVMRGLPDCSVDSVVTDPPAGISFMGRDWDHHKGGRAQWIAWLAEVMAEALRVVKPGGHAFVWAMPRTSHWTATALEDSGWEIRDCVVHLFGSGFPKSLDVSKAIDKAAGATREVVGPNRFAELNGKANADVYGTASRPDETAPATPDAARWQGWGTALKPASEHWWLARKPLIGTVAANVLAHGTGALNIDACRIATDDHLGGGAYSENGGRAVSASLSPTGMNRPGATAAGGFTQPLGRWPANVVLDESQASALDEQSGTLASGANPTRRGSDKFRDAYGDFAGQMECEPARGADVGGASRFYYTPKADSSERPRVDGVAHPTVKPVALMRWLARLVTPPGGVVLDPFAGSGTTAEACIVEGFQCIAIEREASYLPLIVARISKPIETVLL